MAQGKKHTAEVRRKVRELRKSGEKLRGIAEKTGLPKGTIWAICNPRRVRAKNKRAYTKRLGVGPLDMASDVGTLKAIRAIIASNVADTQKLLVIDLLVGA
jgi:hypothetical protein